MPDRSPNMRERRLIAELRRMRDTANLTLEEMALRTGWSISTLSRIETHKRRIKVTEVSQLLDLYAVKGERREQLLELARAPQQTNGWWDAYAGSLPTELTNYISLEAEAASLRCYDSMVFHGLLQTEVYAEYVIRAGLPSTTSPQEIARRVEVRGSRQELLTREHPLSMWTVIDETVLTRTIGSPAVMRAQLERVIEISALPNATVQVLRHRPEEHPALTGTFSIIGFPGRYDPDVVYVETMDSSLYIEDETQVYRYTLAFDQLRAIALGPAESVELIAERVHQL
jgi:transcriptional regulator with XRE-family HTH domain